MINFMTLWRIWNSCGDRVAEAVVANGAW